MAEPAPFLRDRNVRALRLGKSRGPVLATAIHDDALIAERETVETGFDIARFVFRDHDGGEPHGHRDASSCRKRMRSRRRRRAVTEHPERKREIIFPDNLPAPEQVHRRRVRARHIPAVQPGPTHQRIAGPGHEAVLVQTADVILEQDQPRFPALEIETAQHLEVRDPRHRPTSGRSGAGALPSLSTSSSVRTVTSMVAIRAHARDREIGIERRKRACHMQPHDLARLVRRGAGHLEHLGLALPAQLSGEIGQRLDQDAGPARLLQMIRLRILLRIVGADLDEKTARPVAEKLAHQGRFELWLEYGGHAAIHPRGQFLAIERERLTMSEVECPGSKSTSSTSPP